MSSYSIKNTISVNKEKTINDCTEESFRLGIRANVVEKEPQKVSRYLQWSIHPFGKDWKWDKFVGIFMRLVVGHLRL